MGNHVLNLEKVYDFGVLGVWFGLNYGSALTYFGLYSTLREFGLNPLMIDKPVLSNSDEENKLTHSRRFAKDYFEISDRIPLSEYYKYNFKCNGFVVGSDQVWNYGISKAFGKSFYLDFVDDNKKKISYAASFGHNKDFAPHEERLLISQLLNRFDNISVREDDGVKICREIYNVDATRVLDPVFLTKAEYFEEFESRSGEKENGEYLLVYMLDATQEKKELINYISKKLMLKPIILLDGFPHVSEINRKFLQMDESVKQNINIYDWVYLFKNSSYVITDSFHGMCFSLIFKKQFIPILNRHRGISRFTSLAKIFNLQESLVSDPSKIVKEEIQIQNINYNDVDNMLRKEREMSKDWLMKALQNVCKSSEKKKQISQIQMSQEIERFHKHPEFIKIRLLATLLRNYGVKHVVISPGGRDVPLIRMFENNEESFIIHYVTDERSAAYFGLGIASRIQYPVACICTSGTAASNYLPAVTEAYYTGIPLILITADRKDVYHEQGEDQTIPQRSIYKDVIKKSITLTEENSSRAEYHVKREISDCILETIHNGFGPVHINIALDDLAMGANINRQQWKLLPNLSRHLLRVSADDEKIKILRWVKSLARSSRILIVYGQNPPPSEKQHKFIESFVNKYNCVVVVDHIANLSCSYCIKPFNMLRAISNKEFNDRLTPDILISVGGKRLMNDPLTMKIRHGSQNIRHWDVSPSGKVKDFFFRETSILEMSQDFFFEFFSTNAGNIKNNEEYYKLWFELVKKYKNESLHTFDSQYIQEKFYKIIPKGSFLHLGVGEIFYTCRKFYIDPSIEVYCNMGTNGIDGSTSTFMGQCSVTIDRLCFLIIGDLSFFYDMNGIWNKKLSSNIRILLINNGGSAFLSGNKLKGASAHHNAKAKGWVESVGFKYMSASNKEDFDKQIDAFVSKESDCAMFFEIIY